MNINYLLPWKEESEADILVFRENTIEKLFDYKIKIYTRRSLYENSITAQIKSVTEIKIEKYGFLWLKKRKIEKTKWYITFRDCKTNNWLEWWQDNLCWGVIPQIYNYVNGHGYFRGKKFNSLSEAKDFIDKTLLCFGYKFVHQKLAVMV